MGLPEFKKLCLLWDLHHWPQFWAQGQCLGKSPLWTECWELLRVTPCPGLGLELVIPKEFSAYCCSLSLKHRMILLRRT